MLCLFIEPPVPCPLIVLWADLHGDVGRPSTYVVDVVHWPMHAFVVYMYSRIQIVSRSLIRH